MTHLASEDMDLLSSSVDALWIDQGNLITMSRGGRIRNSSDVTMTQYLQEILEHHQAESTIGQITESEFPCTGMERCTYTNVAWKLHSRVAGGSHERTTWWLPMSRRWWRIDTTRFQHTSCKKNTFAPFVETRFRDRVLSFN
jgi:hypothetical protein